MSCCRCECECGLNDKDDKDPIEKLWDRLTDPAFPPPLKYQLSDKLIRSVMFDEEKAVAQSLELTLKDCDSIHATFVLALVDKTGDRLIHIPEVTLM